jgi:hypothetical protein
MEQAEPVSPSVYTQIQEKRMERVNQTNPKLIEPCTATLWQNRTFIEKKKSKNKVTL